MKVTLSEAKAKLPKLVALAERGQESVITRNGKAVARLVGAVKRGRANSNAIVIDRMERFGRTLKLPRHLDLGALIGEGRL